MTCKRCKDEGQVLAANLTRDELLAYVMTRPKQGSLDLAGTRVWMRSLGSNQLVPCPACTLAPSLGSDRWSGMNAVCEAVKNNARVVAERKGRPGFDARMQSYVLARDPKRGVILLGGLGCQGVGEMWFREDSDSIDKPGYAEAKIVDTGDDPMFGFCDGQPLMDEQLSMILSDHVVGDLWECGPDEFVCALCATGEISCEDVRFAEYHPSWEVEKFLALLEGAGLA